jgi:diguanylate cyclase
MKYEHSVEKSAELLRQAIQLMAKQKAPLHPISYAVWYDYVAGTNVALNGEVDLLISKNGVLDEQSTNHIFSKHIAELDEDAAKRITNGFQKVMTDISTTASKVGVDAEKFGSALEQWAGDISQEDLANDLNLSSLCEQTRNIKGSIGSLRMQLAESTLEIEVLKNEIKKAKEEALSDGLTGLINRRGFDMALSACITQSMAKGPSMLIADIDFFKRINDTYGHLFGDKVIQAVSKILKAHTKDTQTAARYGGEEFVLLLPETSLDEAQRIADQIRTTVEKVNIKNTAKNESIANITISLGVASYTQGESITEFVARADKALYQSKHAGRNRVSVSPSKGMGVAA